MGIWIVALKKVFIFNFFRSQTYDTNSSRTDFKIYQNGDLDAGGGIYNYTSYCVRNIESVDQDSNPVFWTQAQVPS